MSIIMSFFSWTILCILVGFFIILPFKICEKDLCNKIVAILKQIQTEVFYSAGHRIIINVMGCCCQINH